MARPSLCALAKIRWAFAHSEFIGILWWITPVLPLLSSSTRRRRLRRFSLRRSRLRLLLHGSQGGLLVLLMLFLLLLSPRRAQLRNRPAPARGRLPRAASDAVAVCLVPPVPRPHPLLCLLFLLLLSSAGRAARCQALFSTVAVFPRTCVISGPSLARLTFRGGVAQDFPPTPLLPLALPAAAGTASLEPPGLRFPSAARGP